MNKQEFLAQLRKELSGLPLKDAEDRVTFYSEMIDDRMEEGLSEPEAVSAIGSVDEIAAQIIADIPLSQIAKERIKSKRRLSVLEIILLVIGTPIWLSLTIAAGAVILSLYIALWSVIISLWVSFGSLVIAAIGVTVAAIVMICFGHSLTGIATLGAGIVCAALSIFMFYGCKAITNGILIFTRKMAIRIKNCFVKKEDTK